MRVIRMLAEAATNAQVNDTAAANAQMMLIEIGTGLDISVVISLVIFMKLYANKAGVCANRIEWEKVDDFNLLVKQKNVKIS